MNDFWLFIITAGIAVTFAVLMLLNENAVHSALSLIVTMVAISFLFLLLDAPFLAMIQITVYAGAIMVLFLFVIMLLGAEQSENETVAGPGATRYRWFTGAAIALTMALLTSIGLSILNSSVDSRDIPADNPYVRVGHFAPNTGAVDVYVDDTLFTAGLSYGQTSDFGQLPAGENTVRLVLVEDGSELTLPVTLIADTMQTVIAYGADTVEFAVVQDDLTTISEDRSSRVTVFNAYEGASTISMVDLGSEFAADDTREIIAPIGYGKASDAIVLNDGTVNWTFVDGIASENEENAGNILYRLREYDLERDTEQLIVIASDRQFDGTLRPTVFPVAIESDPSFGGPRAIGYLLFTTFLLPFQMLALLLLAAMVGVIVLTHREVVKQGEKPGVRRRVSRPLANVIASQVGENAAPTDPAPLNAPRLPSAGD